MHDERSSTPGERPATLLAALAHAARSARLAAAARPHEVAARARNDPKTVTRFERAEAWPRNPEALVAAYAELAGVPAKDIWLAAIELWQPDAR